MHGFDAENLGEEQLEERILFVGKEKERRQIRGKVK